MKPQEKSLTMKNLEWVHGCMSTIVSCYTEFVLLVGANREARQALIRVAQRYRDTRDFNQWLVGMRSVIAYAPKSNVQFDELEKEAHGALTRLRTFTPGQERKNLEWARTWTARVASGYTELVLVAGIYTSSSRLLLSTVSEFKHDSNFKKWMSGLDKTVSVCPNSLAPRKFHDFKLSLENAFGDLTVTDVQSVSDADLKATIS